MHKKGQPSLQKQVVVESLWSCKSNWDVCLGCVSFSFWIWEKEKATTKERCILRFLSPRQGPLKKKNVVVKKVCASKVSTFIFIALLLKSYNPLGSCHPNTNFHLREDNKTTWEKSRELSLTEWFWTKMSFCLLLFSFSEVYSNL